jgi:ribosome maturation factor RimP
MRKPEIGRIVALETEWGVFKTEDIVKIYLATSLFGGNLFEGRIIEIERNYLSLDMSKNFRQSLIDLPYDDIYKMERVLDKYTIQG